MATRGVGALRLVGHRFLACVVLLLSVQCKNQDVERTADDRPNPGPVFESTTGTLVVEVDGPSGSRVRFQGPHELTLEMNAPAVACSMPAGTWSIEAIAPGHHTTRRDVSLKIEETAHVKLALEKVREEAPRIVDSEIGLIALGSTLSPRHTLHLSSFREAGSHALERTARGRKVVRRRNYDGEAVASQEELQWKLRTVVLHAFQHRNLEDYVKDLVSNQQGRHFLLDTDGHIHQLVDLADRVPVFDKFQDRTAIHIDIQIPLSTPDQKTPTESATINGQPTQMPRFTSAQHVSLRRLLAEINSHFPRIHLRTPAHAARNALDALPWPRLYRGILAYSHVDKQSVLPGPGLDYSVILPTPVFDRTSPGESNEDALWIQAKSPTTRLMATGPEGTRAVGVGTLVMCRPSPGPWKIEGARKGDTPLQRQVDVGKAVSGTNLTTLSFAMEDLGALRLETVHARKALLHMPDSQSRELHLPTTVNHLRPGTYRVECPLPDRERSEVWAVSVQAGKTSMLHIPNSDQGESSVIVAGRSFRLDRNVRTVTFQDVRGLSFYRAQKAIGARDRLFEPRKTPEGKPITQLGDLAAAVRLVVLHADVLEDIETAFHVLHSKGLSSHFGIDFDGTIYQMLDPLHVAYGAAEVNPISIQIDLNNRMHNLVKNPAAPPYPAQHKRSSLMSQSRFKRPLSRRQDINGKPYQAYGYTDAQYRSLGSLLRTLAGVLSSIELAIPPDSLRGIHQWADSYEEFRGIIGHFHLTPRRWDPGPGFAWFRLSEALSGHSLEP